jgi:hypothetical protein
MLRSTLVTVQTALAGCITIACSSLGVALGLVDLDRPAVAFCVLGVFGAAVTAWSAMVDLLYERRRRLDNARHLETMVGELTRAALGEAAAQGVTGESTIDATGRKFFHHPAGVCAGESCAIHHPSDHHMRTWPLVYRADRSPLIERLCPHGVGHPDPDSLDYLADADPTDRGAWGVHGCDGCCGAPDAPPAPTEGEDDTNGRGARIAALQDALTDAVAAVSHTPAPVAEVETADLERCVFCHLPIFEKDGRTWHELGDGPPRQSCPPKLVQGRVVTVATPPS